MLKLLFVPILLLSASTALADNIQEAAASPDKLEIAASQSVTKEDQWGHTHQSTCGSYVMRTSSGAKVGLASFVYTGGTLYVQGDKSFATQWNSNCQAF